MGSAAFFMIISLLLVTAVAQNPSIAFTSVPPVVIAGQRYNITWAGGDASAITITLRKGDPRNLDTIGVLASNIIGNYFIWTVDDQLPSASDYALQISQSSSINYSGLFAIVGILQTSNAPPGISSPTSARPTTFNTAVATQMSMTTIVSKDTTSTPLSSTSRGASISSISATTSTTRTTSKTGVPTVPGRPTNAAALLLSSSASYIIIIITISSLLV